MASLKYDVINGSQDERAIFASHVREAVAYIDTQAAQIEALKEKLLDARRTLAVKYPSDYDSTRWEQIDTETRSQLAQEMPGVRWE